MNRFPAPQFQQLHLVDLPPELFAIVFLHISVEDSRRLSTACRYLRDIASRYIYKVICHVIII